MGRDGGLCLGCLAWGVGCGTCPVTCGDSAPCLLRELWEETSGHVVSWRADEAGHRHGALGAGVPCSGCLAWLTTFCLVPRFLLVFSCLVLSVFSTIKEYEKSSEGT